MIMIQLKKCCFLLFLFVLSSSLMAQSLVIRDKYKVKKKDTIYGIAGNST